LDPRGKAPAGSAVGLTEPTPRPVPADRPLNLAAHGKAHLAGDASLAPEEKNTCALDSPASPEQSLKFVAPPEPLLSGEFSFAH
jgi:hypothetical protein